MATSTCVEKRPQKVIEILCKCYTTEHPVKVLRLTELWLSGKCTLGQDINPLNEKENLIPPHLGTPCHYLNECKQSWKGQTVRQWRENCDSCERVLVCSVQLELRKSNMIIGLCIIVSVVEDPLKSSQNSRIPPPPKKRCIRFTYIYFKLSSMHFL